MPIPFEPMTTEKLKSYFDKKVDSNGKEKETYQRREMSTKEKDRNKLYSLVKILKTRRQ